jgi:dCMP deaminase
MDDDWNTRMSELAEERRKYIVSDNRPSFEEYFFGVAKAVAVRADCLRRRAGAVLVYKNRIVSTGYNGTVYSGTDGCLKGACPRGLKSYAEVPAYSDYSNCISVHAEINAICGFLELHEDIMNDEQLTSFLKGCTLYVSEVPCAGCVARTEAWGILDIRWP